MATLISGSEWLLLLNLCGLLVQQLCSDIRPSCNGMDIPLAVAGVMLQRIVSPFESFLELH